MLQLVSVAFLLLIAKAIRMSHAKFHCNRLTTVQDVQYSRLCESHFLAHMVCIMSSDLECYDTSQCQINAPKQYIFNFFKEIKIFNKL